MEQNITVGAHEAGQRLDVWCVAKIAGGSRATIQKSIKTGQTTVNGRQVKPGYVVRGGDVVRLGMVATAEPPLTPPSLGGEKISILDEDREWVVINKPAGMDAAALARWFSGKYVDAHDVGETLGRPGIVHRLDKDTTGVMILARTHTAYVHLLEQFKRRRIQKEYLALVFGVPGEPKGRINRALKRSQRYPLRRTIDDTGKEAITEWRMEKKFSKFALLRVFPLTGRMHQIRAHLHWLGFPVVGDALYTFKRQKSPAGVTHQLLHAEKLALTLPGGAKRTFTAPLPEEFQRVLDALKDPSGSPKANHLSPW